MENTVVKRVITFSELLGGELGHNLDSYFKNNAWELQEWSSDSKAGYQVFFGAGVQVDNLYEYGFPYLYDKEEVRSFANNFFNKFVVPATYVSFWEGGAAFEFPCKVNTATKEVFDIEIEPDVLNGFDFFLGESIVFADGTEFQLCEKGELANNKDGYWLDKLCALKLPDTTPSLDEQIESAQAVAVPPKDNHVSKGANLEQMF